LAKKGVRLGAEKWRGVRRLLVKYAGYPQGSTTGRQDIVFDTFAGYVLLYVRHFE